VGSFDKKYYSTRAKIMTFAETLSSYPEKEVKRMLWASTKKRVGLSMCIFKERARH